MSGLSGTLDANGALIASYPVAGTVAHAWDVQPPAEPTYLDSGFDAAKIAINISLGAQRDRNYDWYGQSATGQAQGGGYCGQLWQGRADQSGVCIFYQPAYPPYVYSATIPQDALRYAPAHVAEGVTAFSPEQVQAELLISASGATLPSDPSTWIAAAAQTTPAQTPPQTTSQQASIPPVTATPIKAGSFALRNTTRPGQAFQVGDAFEATITGASPNLAVSITAQHNGTTSTSMLGQTDASGNFRITGMMSSAEIGAWRELWSVSSLQVADVQFTVSAATEDEISTSTGQTARNDGKEIVGGNVANDVVSSLPAFLQPVAEQIRQVTSELPSWAWIAIAAAVVMFLNGGKKR